MGDSISFEVCICLFDLLLEVNALEAFLSESASLRQLLCTHVKVEDEIWLEQSSVCTEAPIITQSLKLPPKVKHDKIRFVD